MQNLKETLEKIKKEYKSPKLKKVKARLLTTAFEGKSELLITEQDYDLNIIEHLKNQGLNVESFFDERQGESWIKVKW